MKIEYKAGYKYQLHKRVDIQTSIFPVTTITLPFIKLTTAGVLKISAGFAWDGLSGPTYDTLNSMPGSAAHDALYRCLRSGKLDPKWREEIDNLFRRILLGDGVWRFRARYLWRVVRRFAEFAASPKNRRKIIRAGRGS